MKYGWLRIAGKGNRNGIEGKIFLGRKDGLISEGSDRRPFASLYWRTGRGKKSSLLKLY